MTFPQNEAETILFFKLVQKHLELKLIHLQTAFPDAIIEDENGVQFTAEFEYLAKNFLDHGHDPVGCNVIICHHNNWPDAPLPVLALDKRAQKELALVRRILNSQYPAPDLDAALDKIHDLQISLNRNNTEVKKLKESLKRKDDQIACLENELGAIKYSVKSPRDTGTAKRPTKFFPKLLKDLGTLNCRNDRLFIRQVVFLAFITLLFAFLDLIGLE